MKAICTIKKVVDEDTVEIEIERVRLLCFASKGINHQVGDKVVIELNLFDDIEIIRSEIEHPLIRKGESFFAYYINGILDIDTNSILSVIDFSLESEDLYDYAYLDRQYVEMYVPRFDIDFQPN